MFNQLRTLITQKFGLEPKKENKNVDWSHPVLATLRSLPLPDLEALLDIQVIWHVACYIITDSGNILLQKKPFMFTNKTRVQSFGGCNYPNHLVRMMNSLRLELMDECGLILTDENLIRCSPLIVLYDAKGSTLLQVLLVKDEATVDCWSAETARKFTDDSRVVPDAGGKKRNEIDEKIRKLGEIIHKIPLLDAPTFGNWRTCDLESLGLLGDIIEKLRAGDIASDELLILSTTTSGATDTKRENFEKLEKLKTIFDSPTFSDFRRLSRTPWRPILWDEAERLFQVTGAELIKLP